MSSRVLFLGCLACAVAVGAGAFGAHGLEGRLDARELALWETAARYLMYSGLGAVAAGLGASWRPSSAFLWGGGLLLAGGLVFAGTVFALALGGPRWLGAVTPLGGLAQIVGWLTLGWAGLRSSS